MSHFPSRCLCSYPLPRRPCHLKNTHISEDFSHPQERWPLPHWFPPPHWRTSGLCTQDCHLSTQSSSTVETMSYISWHHGALYRASENHLLIMTAPLPGPVNKYFFNPYGTPDPLHAAGHQLGGKGHRPCFMKPTLVGGQSTEEKHKLCWGANHHTAVTKRRQPGGRKHTCKGPEGGTAKLRGGQGDASSPLGPVLTPTPVSLTTPLLGGPAAKCLESASSSLSLHMLNR